MDTDFQRKQQFMHYDTFDVYVYYKAPLLVSAQTILDPQHDSPKIVNRGVR